MFPVELRGTRAQTLMWAHEHEVEQAALQQLRNIAALKWVHGIRVMPDVHLGKGATVGSVIAMRDAVSPAAVGVDIGCGMESVRTDLTAADLPDNLRSLRSRIEAAVPVGFQAHRDAVDVIRLGHQVAGLGASTATLRAGWDRFWGSFGVLDDRVQARESKAHKQMGTLGGGNHFIEVCLDQDDHVWILLHSGSRNIGKELAERHMAIARGLPHNVDLPDRDLAVFVSGTPEMEAYRRDLTWAQEYAARNRAVMLALVCRAVAVEFAERGVRFEQPISCFAGETSVLTEQGCRPIAELAGGMHTLLTEGGNWVKAPVVSFGYQPLWELVVGRYGQERTIRTTAEHRWLLRPKVAHHRTEAITSGLRVGDRLAYVFPKRPDDLRPSREGIARGFVFGDGSIAGDALAHAVFFGSKDLALLPYFDNLERVRTYYYLHSDDPARKTYVRLNEVAQLREQGQNVQAYKRLGGLPREWKREYPALDGSTSDLYGWLAGYFAADGEVGKTGRPAIWSANREDLEFFKSACDVLGIWTLPIRRRTREGFGRRKSDMFVMGISPSDVTPEFFVHAKHRSRWAANRSAVERRGWTVRSVRPIGDVEEVFCAVVEDTHSFALEGNILTGNCHHNYVAEEFIDGVPMLVTRKGAVRAGEGDLALIPGSMGTRSYVVRGKGNPASFQSASHGAGRRMSRNAAKKQFTVADLIAQTEGVESRKDAGVVDEIPAAYKDIDEVIEAQRDLVDVVATLRQVLCVKG